MDKTISLQLSCLSCQHSWPLTTLVTTEEHKCNLFCSSCRTLVSKQMLLNRLNLVLRQQTTLYYQQTLHCKDQMCGLTSDGYRIDADHCPEHTCKGKVYRAFNENRLYNNLNFLKKLFNCTKYANNPNFQYILQNLELRAICLEAQNLIETLLGQYQVSLSQMFSFMSSC